MIPTQITRWVLLFTTAACATLGAAIVSATPVIDDGAPVPGAVKLKINVPIDLSVQSHAVPVGNDSLRLISIQKGTFRLDEESRLTAVLNAWVAQYANIDYWIYVAVFDNNGKLLSTSSHKEEIKYIRLGRMLTIYRDITLDFGVSKTFQNAAYFVVSICERNVPEP